MENNSENQFMNDIAAPPEKPQFLKVLCILSFVACGLSILMYLCGTFCLALSGDKIAEFWDKVLETQPQLDSVNPVDFFHEIGKICAICLLANIISLVGVIMMWQLNKIGFFIYAAAEFITYFFGMDLKGSDSSGGSYGTTIFMILIDLTFIIMYAVNLKHMNKSVTQQA